MPGRELAPTTLTPDAFAPFGHVIAIGHDAPTGALALGGGVPRFWVMPLQDRPPVFDRITRHRAVGQCLSSAYGRPWWLAVAAPDSDPADEGAIQAFAIPPATAVLLHVGTWHAGPFFAEPRAVFFNLELSDTNDVDHDTVVLPVEHRIVPESAALPSTGRRVLVVANRTATSPQLLAALRRMAGAGVTSFRVLVPVTSPGVGLHALASASDPMAGLAPMANIDLPMSVEAASREARERLATLLDELADMGVDAVGEVGVSDPLEAINAVLAAHPMDEILLSTLPAGLSKWLSRDLPSRCAKRFGVPVTHVEATA
jgi:ureidoglycolate lyase